MKLLLRSNFPLFLFLLFLITGCSKENAFKNPVSVTFNVGMNPQGVSPSDDLTFSDGYVILQPHMIKRDDNMLVCNIIEN